MTMLRCDSFDFYSSAQLTRYWTIGGAGNLPSIGAGTGRNGTNCLSFTHVNSFVDWTFPTNLAEGFQHFALSWTRASTDANSIIFSVIDNLTTQIYCFLRADRKIQFMRGDGTVLGVTSAALPAPGILIHVQVRWKIDNSAGVIHVKFDDVDVLNLTGIDTQVSTNAYGTFLRMGAAQGGENISNCLIDDFIFNDTAGSVNNGFIGDKRVQWCPALAEGAQNDYTPSTGTNNAALVDDNPANDDTDYIESSTVGHIDLVTVTVSPNLPTGASVAAVAVVTTEKKTDGGTRTARHKTRFGSGPTIVDGPAYAPLTTYTIRKSILENAITPAEVNAPMQVGVEVLT